MNEDKIKHLEFIQGVITRMNSCSFQIKSWLITIISAIFAIYASNQNKNFIFVTILPTLLCWFLDAYYLQQERKFRGIYNDVSGVSEKPLETKPYEMRPDRYNSKLSEKYGYFNVFKSCTIIGFYLPILVLIIGCLCILH